MVGRRSFPFGARPIFRCELLVSGRDFFPIQFKTRRGIRPPAIWLVLLDFIRVAIHPNDDQACNMFVIGKGTKTSIKKSGNKHHLGCIPKQPTSTADSVGPSALHVGVGSVPMRVEDAERKRGNLHPGDEDYDQGRYPG